MLVDASAADAALADAKSDSRTYTPLADVAPVLVDDSGAAGMQHMAVVRAIRLPAPPPH